MSDIAAWKQHPALRANYVRLLSPEGRVEDIWRGYLEGALEGSDIPLRVFYSEKQWNEFLRDQKEIDNLWSSRHVFTVQDRIFLEQGRVVWLDDMLWSIYLNYENLELTDEDIEFLRDIGVGGV